MEPTFICSIFPSFFFFFLNDYKILKKEIYVFAIKTLKIMNVTNSLRRGYQVYKEVCASCHSLQYVCYRHLVGYVLTEKEAKRDAAAALIEDGPDDQGELYLRPGTLMDVLPPPYKNDMVAKSANNGLKDFKLFCCNLIFSEI
ncbi:hypothetical protein RFI_01425 [Reticulomyxa filosa]|uniref:Cytochrome c domain-containing protein n=1 Tax=Reticulomyxa filosa TaxID=46433 RepID=X6PD83_RETFI|nr:hypothetical protein RFI_01425 [Reticulomyxa filosa]|eukprot:ETO35637.1 hypothetical protein RFI_01425 [Reticulomyxa filosa]